MKRFLLLLSYCTFAAERPKSPRPSSPILITHADAAPDDDKFEHLREIAKDLEKLRKKAPNRRKKRVVFDSDATRAYMARCPTSLSQSYVYLPKIDEQPEK